MWRGVNQAVGFSVFNILHQLVVAGQAAMQNTDYLLSMCEFVSVCVCMCVLVVATPWFGENRLQYMCLCIQVK